MPWLAQWVKRLFQRVPAPQRRLSYKDYLDSVVRTMGDMLIVIGPDGRIEMVNPAALAALGYTEAELVGQPFQIVFMQTAGRTGIDTLVERGSAHHTDKVLRARDGRAIPVLFSGRVMPGGPGRARVVCVAQDITARKAAEARLLENETRHRIISQLASDYAFSVTIADDGTLHADWMFGAFERITGFTTQEIALEGRWQRLIHPADRPLLEQIMRELIEQRQPREAELRLVRRSGEVRHLRFRYHPVVDPQSGRVTRVYGAAEDITARKQAELSALEALLQTERVRLLSDFIRDVSHDVRTPLTTIYTSLYLLRRLDADPARRAQHYDRIAQQTARLEDLLESMLTLARLDQGEDFEYRSVDVNSVVTDMGARVMPLLEAQHIAFRYDLHPDLPLIQADKDELQRALLNLLGNAARFTPEGGAVTARTAADDAHVIIEVRDTGIGIAPDDLERIFERFYRVEGSRSAKTGGAGLGLTITRKIIEQHGGQITVESQPGVGSTFRVLLPLTRIAEQPAP